MAVVQPIQYSRAEGKVRLLDQRRLPESEEWLTCSTAAQAAAAISAMVVRGAPAIGITAAYGMAMAARQEEDLVEARAVLAKSRPTAVNLAWALERVGKAVDMEEEAVAIHLEDVRLCQRLGKAGASLLDGGVLTICNTGALATGGHGTALGMVRSALSEGRSVHLYALETRPYNQGSRLTTWECSREGIPCTLLTDSMAGALLASGRVTTVVAGADRVANNGDTANKIGTYTLAVLAKHHKVPFYIAMPMSTLDRQCPDGGHIPIEERPAEELLPAGLEGVQVWNPAFDVTPANLITGWVSEEGVWTKDNFWV